MHSTPRHRKHGTFRVRTLTEPKCVMRFYGRENALSALKGECKALDAGSRLAVVTGRHRIGKQRSF